MAKLAFTKLSLSKNQEVKIVEFNGQDIEVKQYLPVNDKFEVIGNIINRSADDNNFANPLKVEIFTALEIISAYTNISFTEKQKEDPSKIFDLVVSSGLYKEIICAIPHTEIESLQCYINSTIDAVYKYRNSIMGLLENITTDYSNLNLEATEIQKKLADPNNMQLLRDVLTKLG